MASKTKDEYATYLKERGFVVTGDETQAELVEAYRNVRLAETKLRVI